MTYIFEVFASASGNKLTGEVQYRDPDNYGFSQGPAFGVQLLMEAWREGVGSVSDETKAEFKRLFALYFDNEVRAQVPSPVAEFERRTAEIVKSFEIEEDDDEPEEGEGTCGFFTLEVSDPRYLAHFAPNAMFQMAFTGHLPT